MSTVSPSAEPGMLMNAVGTATESSMLMTSLRALWARQAERIEIREEDLEAVRENLLQMLPPEVLSPFSADPHRTEKIRAAIHELLRQEVVDLPPSPQMVEALYRLVAGLGPLEGLIRDKNISEIIVEAPGSILVERDGMMYPTGLRFASPQEAVEITQRLVILMGKRISRAEPIVSFNLPDGSRLTATIPPASLGGPTLSIRRFRERRFSLQDWVRLGSMSPEMADYLDRAIAANCNMLIAGSVSTGKTTLLETLLSQLRPGRDGSVRSVVIIEDTHELRPTYPHVRQLVTSEEIGLTLRDLAMASLRMRPDVIVIGETRGPEAADMVYAMSAGIAMGLTTIHAASSKGALERMMIYVQMAGADSPYREVPHLLGGIIAGSIDIVVHLWRFADGARKVAAIDEVLGYEKGEFQLQPVFRLEDGRFVKAPGYRPGRRVAEKLSKLEEGCTRE